MASSSRFRCVIIPHPKKLTCQSWHQSKGLARVQISSILMLRTRDLCRAKQMTLGKLLREAWKVRFHAHSSFLPTKNFYIKLLLSEFQELMDKTIAEWGFKGGLIPDFVRKIYDRVYLQDLRYLQKSIDDFLASSLQQNDGQKTLLLVDIRNPHLDLLLSSHLETSLLSIMIGFPYLNITHPHVQVKSNGNFQDWYLSEALDQVNLVIKHSALQKKCDFVRNLVLLIDQRYSHNASRIGLISGSQDEAIQYFKEFKPEKYTLKYGGLNPQDMEQAQIQSDNDEEFEEGKLGFVGEPWITPTAMQATPKKRVSPQKENKLKSAEKVASKPPSARKSSKSVVKQEEEKKEILEYKPEIRGREEKLQPKRSQYDKKELAKKFRSLVEPRRGQRQIFQRIVPCNESMRSHSQISIHSQISHDSIQLSQNSLSRLSLRPSGGFTSAPCIGLPMMVPKIDEKPIAPIQKPPLQPIMIQPIGQRLLVKSALPNRPIANMLNSKQFQSNFQPKPWEEALKQKQPWKSSTAAYVAQGQWQSVNVPKLPSAKLEAEIWKESLQIKIEEKKRREAKQEEKQVKIEQKIFEHENVNEK